MVRAAERTLQAGFSLVELLIVLSIIGMVGAIALPRYSQFQAQQRVEAAARRIIADLDYARRRADSTSSSQTVTFDVANSAYALAQAENPNKPSQPYSVNIAAEPYNARIVSASFGGDATLIFNGFGKPDSSGSVTISVGTRQKSIFIGVDGLKVHVN